MKLMVAGIIFFYSSVFPGDLGKIIKFDHITVDQGLSQNSVIAIIQDSKGFMWFGTQEGLNRYDGYSFKVFEHNPDDSTSLSDNYIFSLYESNGGDIWIGTSGGGLNKYNRMKENFTRYNYDPQDENTLSHDNVIVIYEDKAGILWVGTYYGLNKFDPKAEQFTRFYIDPEFTEQNNILAIFEDSSGELWIGSRLGGLNKFDRDSGSWQRFLNDPSDPKSLSHNAVISIFEDSHGDFWVGTLGGGLNKFDKATGEFVRFVNIPGVPTSLSNNIVWTIYEDRSGTLWIGTAGGGLCEFDRENQEFIRHVNDPYDPNCLNNDIIQSIVEDNAGTLWIGTGGGGVNKLDRQKLKFFHYKINPSNSYSSGDNFIWSIEEHDSDAIWIGTQSGGLYLVDKQMKKIEHFIHEPSNPNSLSHNYVYSVLRDKSGIIWIGTNGGGLNKLMNPLNAYDGKNHIKFKHYFYDPTDSTSLGSNSVRQIFEASDGTIWIGTYGGGLNRFDRETETFTRYLADPNNPNGITSDYIFNIHEDRTGYLWIGTWDGGMLKFDNDTQIFTQYAQNPYDSTSLSHNRVGSFYEDKTGFLWIGTDCGLSKFDKLTNSFKRYTKKDGLPNNVIYGILPDDFGNLWISTNRGLSRFNPVTEEFKNFDVSDGLQSNEFNAGAHLKTEDGEMIFGGINGITIFHSNDILNNSYIPPVVLTAFKKYGKEIELEKSISEIDQITLSYQDNSFSFEFTALDYVNPRKNQYAYKLDGYDSDWILCGNSHSATYTRIPPGDYIFKVKGSNNDGIWNEGGTSVKIIIIPPFWQTLWFKTVLILIILTTVYSLYRMRISTIEKKKKELQERVTERTKAAEALQNALDEVERLKNRLQAENIYLQDEIRIVHNFENIITQNDSFKKVLRSVEQVAATDATVLILGESGTGKELLARAIHSISQRKERPLVKVNCSALPVNLIESELFGHEKGAFTGAISRKIGRFDLANEGTLFLDEIGDLPLEVQAKLLRVLQEGEFERLGSTSTIKVNVRIIAATNRDLEQGIKRGTFREDLFYRLNVFPIRVPPLREHKDDIPLLVQHFIKKYTQKIGSNILTVPQNVMNTLAEYHWPGNVRELENIIERAIILSPANKLILGDWFSRVNSLKRDVKFLTLEENEKQYIIKALNKTGWRISGEKGVARLLGINPKTLESRMKKLGITRKTDNF